MSFETTKEILMSLETTEVSTNNNKENSENSEIYDDPMVGDDDSCIVNDVDMRKDENNQSITVEVLPVAVTGEIPPKHDICSEVLSIFASPKSKKRKLSIPTFDELLEKLHAHVLVMNFTKLLLFLESDNKELTFPFVLKDYEEFFEMIVQDINILKSKSLDADYRDISDKIIVAATGYLLTCVYEYKQDFQKIVMVIKKEHNNMTDQSENGISSFSWSMESVMPSSQTSSEVDSTEVLSRAPSPGPISNGFKLQCLRTTLAFIKNDITSTEEFPELNLEQAHFMQLLLESVITFTEFDSNLEIKDLYRALWEAVRIYRLKYEFRIKCEESSGGKKNLLFEKVPKNKPTGGNSNQIMNPETNASKALKPVASKPEASKPEPSKPEASKPEASKPEPSKPVAPKPEPSKSRPWLTMPVIPKLPNVNQNPTSVTKRMLNSKLKMENENLFIKRLPSKFISDALITIRDFLLDDDRHTLILVPKTHTELDFYRNCLTWCRTTFVMSKFGNEFQEMHHQISCILFHVNCTVNKGSSDKINERTGIKEVSYIKEQKHGPSWPIVATPEPAQSAPKKKKVNIQNAIQLAETDNIKLETVINLNQSLRNKKKNKKQKKAKLKAASMEAAVKPAKKAKTWTDGSCSNCSSRGSSRDRSKKVAQAQNVAKRPLNEISQSAKNTFQGTPRSRRGEETIRKEQLKEALSVPVQSDKAMRMMRGMGWSGGALGARGNGITEPLKPTLDLARGAGLGHSRNGHSETIAKKPRQSKTAPAFVSENSSPSSETDKMETDVIVQKTKQLLLGNPTLDTIMETRKPTTSNAKQQPQPLTESSNELLKPRNSNSEHYLSFRQEILHSILELLNSDATSKILTYKNKMFKKQKMFVGNAVKAIKGKNKHGLFMKEEQDIYREIQDKYKKQPDVIFETLYSCDFKTVQIKKKLLTEIEIPKQQELPSITQLSHKASTEKISEENIYSYIMSSGTIYETERAYEALKFKVLFLLNILSFVKSFNEEVEVTFNKILNQKQRTYIQNVVDEVNMRIKFGSSPAETKLCAEIRNHVKDAFLVSMFNHQYTVVTLSKYFRFKRLNRPDNAVKRTCETTVNLDAFCSETFSKPKLNTNEPTGKENNNKDVENNSKVPEINKKAGYDNKVAESNSAYVAVENNAVALTEQKVNEFEHYDSDSSSDEENNNNCTVLKLPPGEKDVISNILCLYNEEKTDTAGIENNSNINNDSASKHVTDNRNKNNIGNGNVVIDNNDNQVIDMKRDSGNTKNTEEENSIVDTEMAEYVVCVDYTEEAVDSVEMTVDINKEKNTDLKKDGEEIDQTMKHSDIVVANDVVEMVNQHKEIGVDNIGKIIDEGLSKTEDTIDQNVIVIEDSDSNDCADTIVKDEIQNDDNPPTNENDINEDTDVIMIEIDDEPMEAISIKEKSLEVIDKQGSVKEINQEESVGLINQDEPMEEINKVEPSKDVEVAKMEEVNSTRPSDYQIVKGDLEIKTDGDIISKEKFVLSEDLCDTHAVGLSLVKTMDTETNVHNIHISKDTEIKTVRIVHTNHPIEELTNENIKEIQRHISNSIFLATQLPLLKCHGVQNSALIYSCHNKNTYDWLQNIISAASYVKVLNTKEVTKMAIKFYCFFKFDTKDLFRMIEWYNQELSTKDWVVEKTEKDCDSVIFIVRMDKFSIKFIEESDLALFAGIDKIQFSPVWE